MSRWKREGYSLVELMIAMALTAIVLVGLMALFSYGTHNMRITQAMVALQNQAKDATNHISTYAMEANDIEWYADKGVLRIKKPVLSNDGGAGGAVTPSPATGSSKVETETCYYWMAKNGDEGAICFAKKKTAEITDEEEDIDNLPSVIDQQYLLVDDIYEDSGEGIKGFECEVKENDTTGKKVLHVEINLKNDRAKFQCKKDIYMRNQ